MSFNRIILYISTFRKLYVYMNMKMNIYINIYIYIYIHIYIVNLNKTTTKTRLCVKNVNVLSCLIFSAGWAPLIVSLPIFLLLSFLCARVAAQNNIQYIYIFFNTLLYSYPIFICSICLRIFFVNEFFSLIFFNGMHYK